MACDLNDHITGTPPLYTMHTLSKADNVNPSDSGEHVAACFSATASNHDHDDHDHNHQNSSGVVASTTVIWHPDGHSLPPPELVAQWLHKMAALF